MPTRRQAVSRCLRAALPIAFGLASAGCVHINVGPRDAGDGTVTRTEVLRDAGATRRAPAVALIDVDGMLVNANKPQLLGRGSNPVARLAVDLQAAKQDANVRAVILRVNSPGGTATASEMMHRSVLRFKDESGKPVVVLMADAATSGAYLLALPADQIIAHPTTITGSIGVMIQTVSVQPMLKRFGVAADAITSGANKDAGSPLAAPDAEQRATLEAVVADLADRFHTAVREHRPEVVAAEQRGEVILDGRVFSGERALELGLVDQLGDLRDAFVVARDAAGLDAARLIRYDREA